MLLVNLKLYRYCCSTNELLPFVAGRHTLSGACIEPKALRELIPDFEEQGVSFQPSHFHFLFLPDQCKLCKIGK